MIEVGVKELKDGLSGYLRRVARGEQIRVTMRGKPVADLLPAGADPWDAKMRRLIAEGRVTPASKPHSPPPPLQRIDGSASAHILAEREAER